MDIRPTDLPLLVSLDALLELKNVTRAAERLHLSQPALSSQLARLRILFKDPLLTPSETGRGMVATPKAMELAAPLRPEADVIDSDLVACPGGHRPLPRAWQPRETPARAAARAPEESRPLHRGDHPVLSRGHAGKPSCRRLLLVGGDARGCRCLVLHSMAKAAGISIAPGPMFSPSMEFRNCVRINFGHPFYIARGSFAADGRAGRNRADQIDADPHGSGHDPPASRRSVRTQVRSGRSGWSRWHGAQKAFEVLDTLHRRHRAQQGAEFHLRHGSFQLHLSFAHVNFDVVGMVNQASKTGADALVQQVVVDGLSGHCLARACRGALQAIGDTPGLATDVAFSVVANG